LREPLLALELEKMCQLGDVSGFPALLQSLHETLIERSNNKMRRWVLLVALVVGLTFALSSAIALAARKDNSSTVNLEKLAKQASSADTNVQLSHRQP
jgi:hypothetical protein